MCQDDTYIPAVLFRAPALTSDDVRVLGEIDTMRQELRHQLARPRRWNGLLRRTLFARAIQGSNSIEGVVATEDDAVAAVEDEEPLDADVRTWTEITGYRDAMSYVVQLGADPHFAYEEALIRSLHFMMMGHDATRGPGRYRSGPIFVRDDAQDRVVYEGPPAERVPGLVAELVADLGATSEVPPLVRAAMAHLNLVMIHPFRDGNGRMSRCLQTLVLAREQVVEPEFASIEEYLGHNTPAYYAVLAETGGGRWQPDRDAGPWIRFNLAAHHIQAQTVARRAYDADLLWTALTDVAEDKRLPERAVVAMYDAARGLRIRRTAYQKQNGLEDRTAARDLRAMAAAGLLEQRGQTRGRHYVGTPWLRETWRTVRAARAPLGEPYPDTPYLAPEAVL